MLNTIISIPIISGMPNYHIYLTFHFFISLMIVFNNLLNILVLKKLIVKYICIIYQKYIYQMTEVVLVRFSFI